MKLTIAIAAGLAVFSMSHSAMAGTQKFDSESFNSLIDENLRAQEDLQKELQKNAGIKEEKHSKLAVTDDSPSNYAVDTKDFPTREGASQPGLKKDFHRVAQEFKAVEE